MIYTTSLEVSKKLKSLGVKQESDYYWCTDLEEKTFSKSCEPFIPAKCGKHVAIFTLSELPSVLQQVGGKLGWKFKVYHDGAWHTEEISLRVLFDTPFCYHEWLYHYLKIAGILATDTELVCSTCGVELNKCRLIGHDQVGITKADAYLEGVL